MQQQTSPDDTRIAALEADVSDVKERVKTLEGAADQVRGAWWLTKRIVIIIAGALTTGSAVTVAVFVVLDYFSSKGS